jgi:hypothetical protein
VAVLRCGLTSITVIAGHFFEFEKCRQFFVGPKDGSSGGFADSRLSFRSLNAFGLKSYYTAVGSADKIIFDSVIRCFNASSGRG